jgi:hypothetical protein
MIAASVAADIDFGHWTCGLSVAKIDVFSSIEFWLCSPRNSGVR